MAVAFEPVKQTARMLAGVAEIHGERVFIKRASEGSWLKGLFTRIRGSRARRAIRGATILAGGGFRRAGLLAAVEERSFGSVRGSLILCEALDGACVLDKIYFRGGKPAFRHRRRLATLIAREIRRLHDAGIYSRDLQETNLMLREANDGGASVYFVDLEDIRRARTVGEEQRLLNLIHLDRTIGRYAPRAQRLYFLYAYLGGKPERAEARRVVARALSIRAAQERRARGRRRSGDAPVRSDAAQNELSAAGAGERTQLIDRNHASWL
jgi:tRNA A-37 threonylcarbamoyl transferase component Bud32